MTAPDTRPIHLPWIDPTAGPEAEQRRQRGWAIATAALIALIIALAWAATRPAAGPEPLPAPGPAPASPPVVTIWVAPPEPDVLPARYQSWRSL